LPTEGPRLAPGPLFVAKIARLWPGADARLINGKLKRLGLRPLQSCPLDWPPAPKRGGVISWESEMSKFMRFVRDEQGATAIEYGLIAAGISVAIIAIVQGVGTSLVTTFTTVNTALK
jgi:pilus assembly protein Flp/PilA